ncbi:MAG: hypothetical protein EHM72_13875 [Calditrichaeota bacterium]|nr:MAG: hypothetical protein EHM72_13875 [Calditrichota bacterium]
MRTKLFFVVLAFFLTVCQKNDSSQQPPYMAARSSQSDRKPNGGLLRFTLEDKVMHDSFFEGQFTPRGQVFEFDNLQLYNYNLNSDKYPRLLITIDFRESDLSKWVGKTFPMDLFVFTPASGVKPFSAKGEIAIVSREGDDLEGKFDGQLFHPRKRTTFAIKGEFRAKIRQNI